MTYILEDDAFTHKAFDVTLCLQMQKDLAQTPVVALSPPPVGSLWFPTRPLSLREANRDRRTSRDCSLELRVPRVFLLKTEASSRTNFSVGVASVRMSNSPASAVPEKVPSVKESAAAVPART